jgi:hypothetical protein
VLVRQRSALQTLPWPTYLNGLSEDGTPNCLSVKLPAAPERLSNFVQPEQNTKVYRSYVLNQDAASVSRHRGKSPRQAAFFFRNAEVNFQSTQLASLFVMYGLLCGSASGLSCCDMCGGVVLRDLLAKHKLACGTCGPPAAAPLPAPRAPAICGAAPC